MSFPTEQVQAGDKLSAAINARYFFDAPAGNLPLQWAACTPIDYDFDLPGYQVGPEDTSWLEAFRMPGFGSGLGELISEGDAKTEPGWHAGAGPG